MNFRRLSDNDLADFAENVKTLLSGTEISAIDTVTRASLVTAISTLPEDLDQLVLMAMTAEGERKAVVSTKNTARESLISIMAQVRNALVAGLAKKEQFDLCGFDYREKAQGTYAAQDPTELSAFGYSNGVNTLKFKGNNRSGSVVYEIWRREGETGTWAVLSTAKKQSFTDTPVVPGQLYEYKVRATAARSVSNFSNSAVIYGVS